MRLTFRRDDQIFLYHCAAISFLVIACRPVKPLAQGQTESYYSRETNSAGETTTRYLFSIDTRSKGEDLCWYQVFSPKKEELKGSELHALLKKATIVNDPPYSLNSSYPMTLLKVAAAPASAGLAGAVIASAKSCPIAAAADVAMAAPTGVTQVAALPALGANVFCLFGISGAVSNAGRLIAVGKASFASRGSGPDSANIKSSAQALNLLVDAIKKSGPMVNAQDSDKCEPAAEILKHLR